MIHENRARASRLAWLAAITLAVFYLATSLYISSQRLFWFDEIVTVGISGLPLSTILDALRHGADGSPAGYYAIAAASHRLFGSGELAARWISAVAMAAGLMIVFDCARRLTDAPNALVAVAAAACSCVPFYGYEARPYAIYFMLAALSLWIWIATRDDKWHTAIAFGAVLLFAVAVHYYAVILLVPYAIWELSEWKPRRPLSRKLIAGVCGAALSLALQSEIILSYSRQFSAAFSDTSFPPTIHALRAVFSGLFPDGLLLLALIVLWMAAWESRRRESVAEPMPGGEAVGWLFLSIPFAAFVLARLVTNAFLARYVIATVPGVAVAFSSWLWRRFQGQSLPQLGVFVLLAGWGISQQIASTLHPETIAPPGDSQDKQLVVKKYLSLQTELERERRPFLVFSNSIVHLEVAHYSAHPERCILLVLDADRANVLTTMELRFARYNPVQVWNLTDLTAHASESALIDPAPGVLSDLGRAGIKTRAAFPQYPGILYLER